MNTALAGSRPTESALTDSGGRRRPSQEEAEAAVLNQLAPELAGVGSAQTNRQSWTPNAPDFVVTL